MTPQERFAFWQGELSKCIRCNAWRNVCPACSCNKCVFDSDRFDTAQKANSDSFEEQMFHIIRAFHVAGRCTDCGECSRVCPQGIPLHLLSRAPARLVCRSVSGAGGTCGRSSAALCGRRRRKRDRTNLLADRSSSQLSGRRRHRVKSTAYRFPPG